MAKRYQREAIIIRISKKNRQHNGQKKKYKGTNNDIKGKAIPVMFPFREKVPCKFNIFYCGHKFNQAYL
jgi:hypothetical protein